MPFYQTDLVAHPRRVGAKIPRGYDQSSHWAILKLGAKAIGDLVLMWSADPIVAPGVVLVADHQDETMALATRGALNNYLNDGRTLPVRFGDGLGDMLLNPAGGRWKPLRSMQDGVFRVKVGGQLLWSAPDPAGPRKASKQAVDSFNRADSNLDGSTSSDGQFTWSEIAGTSWTVAGNQATASGNTFDTAQPNFTLDTDDMDVQCQIVSVTLGAGSFSSAGLGARINAGVTAGYSCFIENQATPRVYIFDLADAIELVSQNTSPLTGVWKLSANGSAIDVLRDEVSITSTTDGSTAGVNTTAFGYGGDNAANSAVIDDVLIQDIGFTPWTPEQNSNFKIIQHQGLRW